MERRRRTLDEVRAHANYAPMQRVFAEMRRFSEERGLKVAVCCIPPKGDVYRWLLDTEEPRSEPHRPSAFATALRDICASEEFPFLDLEPGLTRAARDLYSRSREYLWWRDDTHLNGKGHEVCARVLEENLLGPLWIKHPR